MSPTVHLCGILSALFLMNKFYLINYFMYDLNSRVSGVWKRQRKMQVVTDTALGVYWCFINLRNHNDCKISTFVFDTSTQGLL